MVLKLTVPQVGALVWVLVYAGLLILAVGLALRGTDAAAGGALELAGILMALVGVVLIGVRSRMVRNAASTNQSVVSYATIIDVTNDDLKLKPGMTANVSIIVQQRPNVLRVGNGAIRVRVPQELLPKAPAAASGSPRGSRA